MLNTLLAWYGLGLVSLIFSLLATLQKSVRNQVVMGTLAIGWLTVSVLSTFDVRMAWSLPALVLDTLMFINASRLIARHYPDAQIVRQVQNSTISFIWLMNVLFLIFLLVSWRDISNMDVIESLLAVSLLVNSFLVALGCLRLYKWRYKPTVSLGEDKLPAVTLAIPARNEDHALTACLEAAVQSNYPKLEILVLDDCSQDTTAQIIRSFAHRGVRFVQGIPPSGSWLGKNLAYQTLANEASGDLILFSGVDVQYHPDAIRRLVEYFISRNLSMASVVPVREHVDAASSLLQTLRYMKQILTLRNVPVISSCWLIQRSELEKHGSFASVKNAVVPESYHAKVAATANSYRFLFATKKLGISTRKKISSQLETATRTLYPLLHRSLIASYISMVLLAWLIIMPLAVLFVFGLSQFAGWLALIQIVVLSCLQVYLMATVRPAAWWLGLIQLPFAVTLELFMLVWSIISYEFRIVYWKGRDICMPILARSE